MKRVNFFTTGNRLLSLLVSALMLTSSMISPLAFAASGQESSPNGSVLSKQELEEEMQIDTDELIGRYAVALVLKSLLIFMQKNEEVARQLGAEGVLNAKGGLPQQGYQVVLGAGTLLAEAFASMSALAWGRYIRTNPEMRKAVSELRTLERSASSAAAEIRSNRALSAEKIKAVQDSQVEVVKRLGTEIPRVSRVRRFLGRSVQVSGVVIFLDAIASGVHIALSGERGIQNDIDTLTEIIESIEPQLEEDWFQFVPKGSWF